MRKLLLAGLVAAGLLTTAGSAIASPSPSGSSEGHESEPYSCPTAEQPTPGGPGYDDAGDCTNGATTYTVWVYDNEVDCGSDQAADTPVLAGNLGGDPAAMQGYGELCTDGDNAQPVKGRIIVAGSMDDGLDVAVDGSNANPAPGDGWVAVHVDDAGPSVACGDAEGNLDSQSRTAADTQEDCG